MTTSIYRRVLAAALLAALVIPFQNCGSKEDLGSYGQASTAAAPAPSAPEVVSSFNPGKVAIFQSTSLSVVASGEGPLTYQWYKDNIALPNETNAVLTINEPVGATPSTPTTTYLYKVIIKDKDGDEVTQDLPLIVERSPAQDAAVPTIVTKTADFTRPTCAVNSNQSPTLPLSVTATGIRLKYDWKVSYLGVTDILSTTTPILNAPVIQATNGNGQVVLNGNGQVVCRVISFGTYTATVTDAFGRTATTNIVVTGNFF